jgi:hypothetical protein
VQQMSRLEPNKLPLPPDFQYHVMLSHDWGERIYKIGVNGFNFDLSAGKDELGRSNHDRIKGVNKILKHAGLVTWLDDEHMSQKRDTVISQVPN